MTEETWISVDIESSGPTPGTGSMVAVGACVVDRPEVAFEVLIRPLDELGWSDEAESIHRLSRARLAADGLDPEEATRAFVDWVDRTAGGSRPVFVAFNATFDWMFVADYAWRFAGRNPFGVAGLDLKALFLGRHLDAIHRWSETTSDHVRLRYPVELEHTHSPLDDAREQAEMCRLIRDGARAPTTRSRSPRPTCCPRVRGSAADRRRRGRYAAISQIPFIEQPPACASVPALSAATRGRR